MKVYVKPCLEYIELRTEEGLASIASTEINSLNNSLGNWTQTWLNQVGHDWESTWLDKWLKK
jgi:hypothetical protein